MVRRRVCWTALLGAAALACGERAGDPIVRLESETGAVPAAGGGGRGGSGGGAAGTDDRSGSGASGASAAGGAGEPAGEPGPVGLCGACESSAECGDSNDACLRHQDVRFCGRDCDDGFGCPEGYGCVQLDNSRLRQCVPARGCPEPAPAPPALDEIRAYLLSRINTERVARDRAALESGSCLDQLAQDSALAYARTDDPLGKFVKECDPIWPSCSCGWTAQAEVAVAFHGLDWLGAIEEALGYDDRFIESFLDFDVTRVGIGFWISGDEAWIALSFA